MTHHITNWELPGSDGQLIYGNTHFPVDPVSGERCEPRGVLICCHGFKGYKDYGFFPALAEAAAQAGLLVHRFNFSHSGMTNAIDTFARPDLFEKDTWRKQIADLQLLLAGQANEAAGMPEANALPTVVYGHSRGAVAALLTAGRYFEPSFYHRPEWSTRLIEEQTPIAGVIAAAAPDFCCRLSDADKTALRETGRVVSPSGRTGQDLYLGYNWLAEMEAYPDLFDPVKAAGFVKCPMLIVHGSGDQTVPVSSAQVLHEAAPEVSQFAVIDHASHTFNCPNPVPEGEPLPYATCQMIEQSVAFAVDCCENVRQPRV